MNIKSLLLGSAAALVAVSGARAADAVVIPEPEAVEYVRVCDAAGAGYFYIPGGETCLKISGYVQYQIATGSATGLVGIDRVDPVTGPVFGVFDATDGWNKATEGRLQFDSWTDSEYGAVTTNIRLTSTHGGGGGAASLFVVDRANLGIGGLNMGLNGSFYDFSQTGAADSLVGNGFAGNQLAYTANFGSGTFGIQLVDDLRYNYIPDVIVKATYTAGDLGLAGAFVYDDLHEAFGAKLTATYAGFGAVVQYSQDDLVSKAGIKSAYAGEDNWVIGANYGFDATDKLKINVGAAYAFNNIDRDGDGNGEWAAGVEATYKLTDTFTVSTRGRVASNDAWDARLRFKAAF